MIRIYADHYTCVMIRIYADHYTQCRRSPSQLSTPSLFGLVTSAFPRGGGKRKCAKCSQITKVTRLLYTRDRALSRLRILQSVSNTIYQHSVPPPALGLGADVDFQVLLLLVLAVR